MKHKAFFVVLGLAIASGVITVLLRGQRMGMSGGMGYDISPNNPVGYYQEDMGSMTKMATSMPAPYYGGGNSPETFERSYEQYGSYTLVAEDVSTYVSGIKEYVASIGGMVLNSSLSTTEKYQSGYLHIKVPTARFSEATARVTQNAEMIIDENISINDITGAVNRSEEIVEQLQLQIELAQARLAEATTAAARLTIQSEIDSLNRKLTDAKQSEASVDEQVTYGSISISVANDKKYYNYDGGRGDISDEFSRAWESVKGFARVLGLVAIWALVYSVVWVPVVIVVKMISARFAQPAQK